MAVEPRALKFIATEEKGEVSVLLWQECRWIHRGALFLCL